MSNTTSVPAVIIRAIEPEDLDLLYSIENDVSIWNVGVTNVPYSRYMLHNYIANSSGDIYTDRQVRLMIENSGHAVVGIIDIVNFEPQHSRAEIGIVIRRGYRSHGYAKAAVRKIISYSRDILHLHQIYVYADKRNDSALGLFETMGFDHKSVLKDWLYDGHKYHDAVLFQLFL